MWKGQFYPLLVFSPKLHQSPDIGQNSNESISNFRISGQYLLKENCYKSRTTDNIDMKLGPVTKFGKGRKTTSRKFYNDFMSANCNVIVIYPIYAQFGAIHKLDSRRRVCKTYIFINSNFLS